MSSFVRTALIGCGGMARYHLDQMVQQLDTTRIVVLCDPNAAMLELAVQKFREADCGAEHRAPERAGESLPRAQVRFS